MSNEGFGWWGREIECDVIPMIGMVKQIRGWSGVFFGEQVADALEKGEFFVIVENAGRNSKTVMKMC